MDQVAANPGGGFDLLSWLVWNKTTQCKYFNIKQNNQQHIQKPKITQAYESSSNIKIAHDIIILNNNSICNWCDITI